LNRFWIIEEFNRNKKNPFKQNFFQFYEFLGPETDIMVQFMDPETDIMVQFLDPEIVIMGERNYIPHMMIMRYLNEYFWQSYMYIKAKNR
jgi:hypothetical protein